jgi:hypothetical protein
MADLVLSPSANLLRARDSESRPGDGETRPHGPAALCDWSGYRRSITAIAQYSTWYFTLAQIAGPLPPLQRRTASGGGCALASDTVRLLVTSSSP